MDLYHIDVYMPQEIINKVLLIEDFNTYFKFTNHVWKHLNYSKDWHHKVDKDLFFNALKSLKNTSIVPFEVGIEDGNIIKYGIKTNYNDFYDIAFIIYFPNRLATFYLNPKNDEHKTLDKSKYIQEK